MFVISNDNIFTYIILYYQKITEYYLLYLNFLQYNSYYYYYYVDKLVDND